MSQIDAPTLRDLTAVLAANVAPFFPRVAGGVPEQQLAPALAPGVISLVSRLAAALPDDYDLVPILARFLADPEVGRALTRLGEPDTAQQLADAFLRAGGDPDQLRRADFDAALDALVAAAGESLRREAAAPAALPAGPPLFPETALDALPRELRRQIAQLLDALEAAGIGAIQGGRIVAPDGHTVVFEWRPPRAQDEPAETAAPPDLLNEPSGRGAEPETGESPPPPPPPPPAPPPPSPATPPPVVAALRLDAAAPPQVTQGRPFDLAVAVRRAGSPPLAPDDLTRRESSDFGAIWPAGAAFLSLRIQISAPDCDIAGGDSQSLRLLAGQDGPTVYFQLTPRAAGPLSIIITVYQETDWIGSTRVRTEATDAAAPIARGGLAMTVESQPLGDPALNLNTLRDALDGGYSDAELRDLCFELQIDYEDLPGEGQAAKARELVLYAKRHALLPALVERVMRDRPGLLVPA